MTQECRFVNCQKKGSPEKGIDYPPSIYYCIFYDVSGWKERLGEKKALYSNFWLPDERSGFGEDGGPA
jgi:hypothetical protein